MVGRAYDSVAQAVKDVDTWITEKGHELLESQLAKTIVFPAIPERWALELKDEYGNVSLKLEFRPREIVCAKFNTTLPQFLLDEKKKQNNPKKKHNHQNQKNNRNRN